MAFISFTPGSVIKSADMNANFVLAVGTDVSKTIVVTHTFTASQTFTGGWTAAAACTISAGGIGVTGNSSVTGGLTVSASVTIPVATYYKATRNSGAAVISTLGFDDGATVGVAGDVLMLRTGGVGFKIRDTANADHLIISSLGAATFISTVTATGFVGPLTGAVTGNVSGNLTGTVLTPSQTNINAIGVLTGLAVQGAAGALNISIDTATGAASDNSSILFKRGAVVKWRVATNFAGANTDIFSIVSEGVGEALMFAKATGAATFLAGVTATTFTGALTGNVTGNLTGSVLTASQTNITAVGTLGSLGVTGTVTAGAFSGPLTGNVTGNASGTAATVTTAAQPAITSVGTLTSLTVSGAITMTAAASKLVPGATSFSHRNNADSADNLIITDAGNVTVRLSLTATSLIAGGSATNGGLNIQRVGTPSAPADGDVWITSAGMFCRVAGVTKTVTLT